MTGSRETRRRDDTESEPSPFARFLLESRGIGRAFLAKTSNKNFVKLESCDFTQSLLFYVSITFFVSPSLRARVSESFAFFLFCHQASPTQTEPMISIYDQF